MKKKKREYSERHTIVFKDLMNTFSEICGLAMSLNQTRCALLLAPNKKHSLGFDHWFTVTKSTLIQGKTWSLEAELTAIGK